MSTHLDLGSREQNGLRGLAQRLATGALPLAIAVGLALGVAVASPQEAQARPKGVLQSGCYHNGTYYAHGQVVEMHGVPYLCQNGRWVLSPFLSPAGLEALTVSSR